VILSELRQVASQPPFPASLRLHPDFAGAVEALTLFEEGDESDPIIDKTIDCESAAMGGAMWAVLERYRSFLLDAVRRRLHRFRVMATGHL
jgi:hypothetical protein